MPAGDLRRTPIFDRHRAAGARLVPFAGWEMPVQYAGVIAEHRAVRERAGVFDVSHMGRFDLRGGGALAFLQSLLSNDLDRIGPGGAQYTLLLDERGCPVDDLIAYRFEGEHFMLVVNASRAADDWAWIERRLPAGLHLRDDTADWAMVAIQGPAVRDLIELPELAPFHFDRAEVCGIPALVAATGYTGEPGVEVVVEAARAAELWDLVVEAGVAPAGLGARDTLRLEVCYPLYGNDLGPRWTALQSGLGWVCALDAKEFCGAEALRAQRAEGGYDRLVPFRMLDRAIPRQGMAVAGGGEVTSGTMSPSLEVGIGMAYVPESSSAAGTEITIDVRGRSARGQVAKRPLYRKGAA
jgi:aminomethyltransferase